MGYISKYKLKRNENGYDLIVYLNVNDTEFSSEFLKTNFFENEKFSTSLSNYIEKSVPNVKINACKIMVGAVLIATLPIGAINGVHASGYEQTATTINYKVSKGDSLWKISNKFNVEIESIRSLNGLTSDQLDVNQMLNIPNESTSYINYKVKSGDSLYNISKVYGTTVERIKHLNNLDSDIIFSNQVLIVENIKNKEVEQQKTTNYRVQPGDTLWEISNKFNISVNRLKSINNLTSDTIYGDQILRLTGDLNESIATPQQQPVPPKASEQSIIPSTEPTITYTNYELKSGENLWTISQDNGIPMTELMKANNLTENSMLSIGQVIKVPVHNIPVKETMGEQYGEVLDWWTEAQYVLPINSVAKVTDVETGQSFMIKRTIGANHADCEPYAAADTTIAKGIWGGFSWNTRPVIVEVDGRKLAASMSFMPHSIQYIENNNFDGHFDIHFLNSTRHKDGLVDQAHQEKINIAGGLR